MNNIHFGFSNLVNHAANYVASWNYSSGAYSALPDLPFQCYSLALDGSNNLYAALLAPVTTTGGTNYLYKWTGREWQNLSVAVPNTGFVRSIYYYKNYLYVALGKFLYKYDIINSTFITTPLYTAIDGFIQKVIVNDQYIYVSVNNGVNSVIAKYSQETNWVIYNLNNSCLGLVLDENNILYASGNFTEINGITYNRIAKLINGNWGSLGDGSGILGGTAVDLIIHQNILYIGGGFTKAGGKASSKVTAWDITNSKWIYFPTITDYSTICLSLCMIDMEGAKSLICGGTFQGLANTFNDEQFDITTTYSLAAWIGYWTKLSTVIVYKQTGGTGKSFLRQFVPSIRFFLSSGTDFTRTGYTLSVWSTKKDDGTPITYQLGEAIYLNSSKVLEAIWTINSYTIQFDSNGEDGTISSVVANYNDVIQLPNGSDLSKPNYTVVGWKTATGTFYKVGQNYTITENQTLYAVWEIIQYTIEFDSNGGTGTVNSSTYIYNTVISLPSGSDLSKPNYSFIGWNTQADGSGTSYAFGEDYTIIGNQTLYALWYSYINSFIEIVDSLYTSGFIDSDISPEQLIEDSINIFIELYY